MKFRLFVVAIIYLMHNYYSAQQTNFEYFNTHPEGLSQSVVNEIMQDSKGYLWISTYDGLNQFDGDVFNCFYREDGLYGHEIECTSEDRFGRIWVATRRGLNCIENDKVIATPAELQKTVLSNHVSKLYYSGDDRLYIALKTKRKLSQNRFYSSLLYWDHINTVDVKLPSDTTEIFQIIEFDSSIFLASNLGLIKLSADSSFLITESSIEQSISVSCLSTFNNKLVIGTNKGLFFYEDSIFRDTTFSYFDTISVNQLYSNDKYLLIGEKKEFFHLYSPTKIESFGRLDGAHTSRIISVFIDREESFWISYWGDGLIKYREKPFVTYTKQFNRYVGGTVHAIYVDEEENLWVGGSNGMFFKPKEARFFKRYFPKRDFVNCKMNSNSIWGILKDSKGRMLICNPRSNLVIFKNNSFSQISFSEKNLLLNGFNKNEIDNIKKGIKNSRSISIDHEKNILIGTFNYGLLVLDENLNCINYFNTTNGLPSNNIQSLMVDQDNCIWVGTSYGIAKIKNDSVYSFLKFPELKKSTYSIRKEKNGNVLAATDYGLYRLVFKNKILSNIKHFDIKNGLASSVIYSMEIDSLSNIYLGTTLGVDKVTEASLNRLNIVEKHYGPSEGFTDVECNTNSSFVDEKGNIWFGTVSISKLRLNYDRIDLVPPNLYINDIRLNYSKVGDWKLINGTTKSIIDFTNPVFFHFQNHLTFDYKAITNVSPKNINYSFKLEPSDTSWSPKTKQSFSTYVNLSPGDYTFKVKAENIDKTQSKVVSYSFSIAKPYWKENWFICLEISTLLVLIYVVIAVRTSRLKKNQLALEQKVNQRTMQLNDEKQKVEQQNKEIKKSINYARRIQNSILPEQKLMKKYFDDFMVYYQPKDIVGGDFYWYRCFGNISVIATVDCTGHGVPGGFMSMMGSLLLDKIIQRNNLNSSDILKELNSEIVRVLDQQSGGEIQDGMDIALCVVDKENSKLVFSGARNGITIVGKNRVEKIDADLFSVGGSFTNRSKKLSRDFMSHEILLEKEDWVFMYTDGFYDQLGGNSIRSLGLNKFENILSSATKISFKRDKFFEKKFSDWKGKLPQIDDVLIIGFKL
ncbi:MAG: two-component regulator propeller domain-containing protein [Bacteroidota bacterium]|nr:two-component regulator propeller domain-containing protein [Bacteroidota bacterium]